MRAYALLHYAGAVLLAAAGLCILGAYWARPPVRVMIGLGALVAAVIVWRTAHQPWHARWF